MRKRERKELKQIKRERGRKIWQSFAKRKRKCRRVGEGGREKVKREGRKRNTVSNYNYVPIPYRYLQCCHL
jgi:hypothetical protein